VESLERLGLVRLPARREREKLHWESRANVVDLYKERG
jgi:hypothetical protein